MSPDALYRDEVLVVEPHGLERINDAERHGTLAGQFNVWFAANMHLTTLVLGALGITLGLGFWGTALSCALGNLFGALGNSLCAAMGPRLGMPQLPMSRSAFGYRGNYLPAFLAWLGYIGWVTVDNTLGSQTSQQLFGTPYVPTAVTLGAATIVITIYGYNFVHAWERWLTRASVLVFAFLTIFALQHGAGPAAVPTKGGAAFWMAWLLEFTIMFSYTVSWAPYAADYARYLPSDTPIRRPFWYSFWGMFLSTTWTNTLGALLGTLAVAGGVIPAMRTVAGMGATAIYAILVLGSISSNTLNMYSGGMGGLTWGLPLRRTGATLVVGAIGVVLSILFGGAQFIKFFQGFLFLLVYWVTPWIAIIAIDFYVFHRRGLAYPDSREFYQPNGAFGALRWAGLAAFAIGVAASVPFMATDWYAGPIGKALGGADFSYIVSFVVAGAIYLATGRHTVPPIAAPAQGT
ncbi:MAG TPA: cytosine permease [bacterium]|nr:cytosine permease [bacterium]